MAIYHPSPKQVIFHGFKKARIRILLGGTQSGKTTAGIADDLIQAVDKDVLPKHLTGYKKFDPPFYCRVFAPSLQVIETVTFEKVQGLVPPSVLLGGTWQSAYDKQLRILHFQNGSQIAFFSYDQDVQKLGGASIHRIHYDEEPPKRLRTESRFRVMAKGGDELFTMTPTEGLSWTYDEWKELLDAAEENDDWVLTSMKINDSPTTLPVGLVRVDMDDNPSLSGKDKAIALAGLSREERTARKSGRFVALHGQIYNDFDRDVHVVPERPLPANVNVVVGIDPGIRHACGVIWSYLTTDDTMVVFEEGYYQGMTIKQVCEEIHKLQTAYDISPIYYVIDPAARNKNQQTGRSDQMEFADHGVVTIAGQHAVTAGINRVKERLQNNRLYIGANCPHLINEFRHYRWRKPPQTEDDGREVPVKKDDHGLDALRYVCMSRPYLPDVPDSRNETELQRLMREDQEAGGREGEAVFAGGIE